MLRIRVNFFLIVIQRTADLFQNSSKFQTYLNTELQCCINNRIVPKII